MKCVHINIVASPRDFLAIGGELQSSEIDNRPSGRVLARNPFRIDECDRPGLDRERQGRVEDVPGGIAQVNLQMSWILGRLSYSRNSGDDYQKKETK